MLWPFYAENKLTSLSEINNTWGQFYWAGCMQISNRLMQFLSETSRWNIQQKIPFHHLCCHFCNSQFWNSIDPDDAVRLRSTLFVLKTDATEHTETTYIHISRLHFKQSDQNVHCLKYLHYQILEFLKINSFFLKLEL